MLALVKPLPKLADSVQFFTEQGIETIGIAPLDIQSNTQPYHALAQAIEIGALTTHTFIVTSTESASRLVEIIKSLELTGKLAVCIGTSCAALLENHFEKVSYPQVQTSEGLVDECLAEVNQPVALIKGDGGRDLIQHYLHEKGIVIREFNVYRRVEIKPPVQTCAINWPEVDTIIATSAALMECMFLAYPNVKLETKSWIVPSERIKETGRRLGCKEITVSHGATHSHLLGCVKTLQRGQT